MTSAPAHNINKIVGITKACAVYTVIAAISPIHLAAEPNKLEEITVTAQKREQKLFDVPMSISALNGEQLDRHLIATLSDIASMSPNFEATLPNGEALPIFSIRGIAMADYSSNQSSPVGVYLDDVYLSTNFMHGLAIFDLDRIEVLKGPQGTLYGKNNSAGAINLISKTPDFKNDGYINLSAGNYQQRGITAAYETPLIPHKLSARLAIQVKQTDGYSKNHAANTKDMSAVDRRSLRLTLNYRASDSLTTLIRLNSNRSKPTAPAVIPEPTFNGIDFLSAQLAAAGEAFYVRPAHFDGHDADANKSDETKVATDGGSITINWETENLNISSVTGIYSGEYDHKADSDGTPLQLLEIDYLTAIDQWSQELYISSPQTERFSYTAGVYINKEEIDSFISYDFYHGLRPIAPNFIFPIGGIFSGFTQKQNFEQKRTSYAIYGQFEYNLSDLTTVTTGLRFTEDENSQFNVHTFITDYDQTPQAGLIPFSIPYDPNAVYPKQQFTDSEWTGTVKLDHKLSDHTLVYGSYSRGYRSGAFNGAAVTDATELKPVDPEYVNAFELGLKGKHLNGRLQYSSALFYYDYRNQQFINVVGVRQLLYNASRSRTQGAELEFKALITEALTLQLDLGLLDTEYTEGPMLDTMEQTWDLSGNQLIAAPDINANIAVDYKIQFNGNNSNLHIDLNYIDDQWFSAFNNTAGYGDIGQSGYTLINAKFDFHPANSNLTISLWGKNLSDKAYKVYAINLSESFGYNYTIRGAPRTYGAAVKLSF